MASIKGPLPRPRKEANPPIRAGLPLPIPVQADLSAFQLWYSASKKSNTQIPLRRPVGNAGVVDLGSAVKHASRVICPNTPKPMMISWRAYIRLEAAQNRGARMSAGEE